MSLIGGLIVADDPPVSLTCRELSQSCALSRVAAPAGASFIRRATNEPTGLYRRSSTGG